MLVLRMHHVGGKLLNEIKCVCSLACVGVKCVCLYASASPKAVLKVREKASSLSVP